MLDRLNRYFTETSPTFIKAVGVVSLIAILIYAAIIAIYIVAIVLPLYLNMITLMLILAGLLYCIGAFINDFRTFDRDKD